MNKIKNFFIAIGRWFKSWFASVDGKRPKFVSIGRWFKSWFASVDGKRPKFVFIGRWFKSWFVSVDGKRAKFVSVGLWFKNWFKEVDGKPNHFIKIGRWFKSLFKATGEEEPKLKTLVKSQGFASLISSVAAALLGIVLGLVIMLVANPGKAFQGFGTLLAGGFNNGLKGIGDVLYYATPILLTGLSVGFAFKTGLFNIGATGQYTMGMFGSLLTAHGLKDVVTSDFLWVICILAGILFGMLWGMIPGLFKALFNVNEVITAIMTNYIGMYLVDMIIKNTPLLYNATYNWTNVMPANSDLPKWGMTALFPNSYANAGFIIAVLVAILLYILLNKTTFGYELKACGTNKNAARYAGINEKKNIILAMVIAGGLAGLGGAVQMQAGLQGTYTPNNTLATQGFDGIAVALLGTSNPVGIIFAALFFAHLKQGGFFMQNNGFKNEIIDVIVGVTVYFAAFALFFKGIWGKMIKVKLKKKKAAYGGVSAAEQSLPDTDIAEKEEK